MMTMRSRKEKRTTRRRTNVEEERGGGGRMTEDHDDEKEQEQDGSSGGTVRAGGGWRRRRSFSERVRKRTRRATKSARRLRVIISLWNSSHLAGIHCITLCPRCFMYLIGRLLFQRHQPRHRPRRWFL